jgi:hypothetical protein
VQLHVPGLRAGMTALALFFLGALISTAAAGTGGWFLRGLWDRYRAETGQARERGKT